MLNILSALPLAGLAAYFAMILGRSLKSRENRGRGVVIRRDDSPFQYWFGIVLGAGVCFLFTAATFLLVIGPFIGLQVKR
jgi:hypothetical protein